MKKKVRLSKEKINLVLNFLGIIIFLLSPVYYYLFIQILINPWWVDSWIVGNAFFGLIIYLFVIVLRNGIYTPIEKVSIKIILIVIIVIGNIIFSSIPLIMINQYQILSLNGLLAFFIGSIGIFIAVLGLERLLQRYSKHYRRQKKISIILCTIGFMIFLVFIFVQNFIEFSWIFSLLGLILIFIGLANIPHKREEHSN
ncbi:MAG: hypothetical protein ACFFBH_00120 [Promethearchaeota archaeon]